MASGEASLEGPLVDEENLVVAARAVPDGELRAFAEDLAERFQRLQRLQAVTNYIAEAETASALEQIIDAAHAVLSADRVTLFTVDHKRQRLCLALSNAASAEVRHRATLAPSRAPAPPTLPAAQPAPHHARARATEPRVFAPRNPPSPAAREARARSWSRPASLGPSPRR